MFNIIDNMVEVSLEKLGLLNWGRGNPKWVGVDFHLIPPEKRPEYLDLALKRFEDMYFKRESKVSIG